MKLYLVKLRGLSNTYGSGMNYNESYVVADNTDEAYKKVRKFLDEKGIGFKHDRELDYVKLIADAYNYAECKTLLFVD